MRNLFIALMALLGAIVATEYNQYSHCREWRLELALREQGMMPEHSWGAAALDFVVGDLIAVGKKWQCGIEIGRSEAIWATVEAVTVIPVVGSAAVWVTRTVSRGFSRLAVLLRETTVLRGPAGFIRGPMAVVGKITAKRAALLFIGGMLLAVYFGSTQLLLDALALLPWIVQLMIWAIVFFSLLKLIALPARAALSLRRGLRKLRQRRSPASGFAAET